MTSHTITQIPTPAGTGSRTYFHDRCEPSGPRETQTPGDLSFPLFHQTMLPLFSRMGHTGRIQDSLAERIQTFVTGNLANRITLKELARFLGYSEKYSSEFFHRQMGTSFSHYLKRLRIMKAQHMLAGEGASVTHIAEVLGFSDSFAFSHFFKRVVGCSPTAFRKQQSDDADRK